MFKRLLICTDFSDGVYRFAHFVPSLAALGLEQLTFLHCVPLREIGAIPRVDTEKVDVSRQRLDVALESSSSGVDVRVIVESGRAIDAILAAAQTHQADLIVLGMPTRNLLTEKLFGSTTMGLCQRSTVPLMVIRPQLVSTYTAEEFDLRCRHLFRCLLVPYDGSNASKYLLDRLKQLAHDRPPNCLERLHLCWVVDDVGRRELPKDYQVEAAKEALASVKTELEVLKVQVAPIEVRVGNPVLEVLEAAQMQDVSAIATSSGSIGKLLQWSVPSFTSELLRRSWHPIIYFPPSPTS